VFQDQAGHQVVAEHLAAVAILEAMLNLSLLMVLQLQMPILAADC
jgi:hypothetical protein